MQMTLALACDGFRCLQDFRLEGRTKSFLASADLPSRRLKFVERRYTKLLVDFQRISGEPNYQHFKAPAGISLHRLQAGMIPVLCSSDDVPIGPTPEFP
jgi:hypothetical protein